MALLPKSYRNGVRIKHFQYNDIEAFEASYKNDAKGINTVCHHIHKGTPGKDYSNGCYTKKTETGGYCRGYTTTETWHGCLCGSSWPCRTPERPVPHGETWNPHTVTRYHSSKSGCGEWTSYYRYDLGCGYDVDDGK